MDIKLESDLLEFRLKDKKIKRSKKKLEKIEYPNIKKYKEAIKWINDNNEGYVNLYEPKNYIKSFREIDDKKVIDYYLQKQKINVQFNFDNIIINNREYPSIIDEYNFNKKYPNLHGKNIFWHQFLNPIKPYFKNKKIIKKITFFPFNSPDRGFIEKELTNFFDNKKIIKSYIFSFNQRIGEKYDFKIFPSVVLGDINNEKLSNKFNKQTLKKVKFDYAYILLRRTFKDPIEVEKKRDIEGRKEKYLLPSTINIINFLLNHSNKNACYLLYYYEGFSVEFINYLCYLSQYFDKIRIFKKIHDQSVYLNLWINLLGYNGKKVKEYNSKNNYIKNYQELLYKFKIFNESNQNFYINFYYNIKKEKPKIEDFSFESLIPKIILFIENNKFPLNPVYNSKLQEYSDLTLNDMNKFVSVYYNYSIFDSYTELNIKKNNWILLSILLGKQNDRIMNYYLLGSNNKLELEKDYGLEDNLYILNSLNFIPNKTNIINKNTFLIITDNIDTKTLYKYIKKAKIIMIKKDKNLPFEDYKIIDKSENYYYLMKN